MDLTLKFMEKAILVITSIKLFEFKSVIKLKLYTFCLMGSAGSKSSSSTKNIANWITTGYCSCS